jgi:hypothetical protein
MQLGTFCSVTTRVCNARICSYAVDKQGNKITKTQNSVSSYVIFHTHVITFRPKNDDVLIRNLRCLKLW